MATETNQAAFITSQGAHPFEVRETPMPTPRAHEVLIRVRAVALNPADVVLQTLDAQLNMVPAYPWVLGWDVAGEVVSVGGDVTRFAPGDRVAGYTDGLVGKRLANTAFQRFTCTNQVIVSKIPDAVSFARAAVLPVALGTAAAGLFEKDKLALDHPSATPSPNGKWVFVYAGSTSVGSCAIMLCRAAGHQVIATASPKNFEYVKSLGASEVFDTYSATLVDDVAASCKGKAFVGVYESIGKEEAIKNCGKIARHFEGNGKHVTTVNPRAERAWVPEDVGFSLILVPTIEANGIAEVLYGDFFFPALENGTLQCKPDPRVVGQGLEAVQEACDILKAGVSATKLVVELP